MTSFLKLGLVLHLSLCAVACQDKAASHVAHYQVRGRVDQVSGQELVIHHEAIPDFVDREGNKVGMMSMQMRFGVPESVSTDGIAIGDKVSMTVATQWSSSPPLQIVTLNKLAADTALSL